MVIQQVVALESERAPTRATPALATEALDEGGTGNQKGQDVLLLLIAESIDQFTVRPENRTRSAHLDKPEMLVQGRAAVGVDLDPGPDVGHGREKTSP